MRYAAGIVTFNPEMQRLQENLIALIQSNQVERVFVVDNASKNVAEIEKLTSGKSKVCLTRLTENIGIAHALNAICKQAQTEGFDWVLTLDQDSVMSRDCMSELVKHTDKQEVGIVCPRIEDRNMGCQYATSETGWEYIDSCITSGNLVRIKAWEQIGEFAEELFIDGVDFDFCIRMRQGGFQILRANNVCLIQEVGHGRNKHLFGRTLSIMNHSPFRLYYIIRNYLYLGKVHHQRLHWTQEVLKRLFIVMAYEHNRSQKARYIWHGFLDYARGKMGKCTYTTTNIQTKK